MKKKVHLEVDGACCCYTMVAAAAKLLLTKELHNVTCKQCLHLMALSDDPKIAKYGKMISF